MSEYFPAAYRRAQQKIGTAAWSLLTEDQQAEAVAEELRLLEEEGLAKPADDAEKPSC